MFDILINIISWIGIIVLGFWGLIIVIQIFVAVFCLIVFGARAIKLLFRKTLKEWLK